MTLEAVVPLSKKQRQFLLFIQILNQYAVRYTSVPIMIQREPLDIKTINTIVSENQYTIDNRAYLAIIRDGFKELIDLDKRLNHLWEEYTQISKINGLMEVENTSARILLETKLKKFFENTIISH